MKLSRKGFTLIELLAVIVLVALVLAIAIPTSIEAYKKARLKTEDVFVKRLSEVIEDYTSLGSQEMLKNNDKFTTSIYKLGTKFEKPEVNIGLHDDTTEYKVYEVKNNGSNITVNNLITNDLLFEAKYVNPNNKNGKCNTEARILIYKDSDAVYCHKIETSQLYDKTKSDSDNCLTKEYVNEYHTTNGNINTYVIDTCVWYEVDE